MKVEVRNLHKSFGRVRALQDVTFSFDSGEIYGFVGPNGAGKTTTMRIISTLDEPNDGDVLVDGYSALENPEKTRAVVGYVPDNLPAHGDTTVLEYLDFFGRASGLRGPGLRKALDDVVGFTGLGPLRDKTLQALSKGMKQRVSLGRALIHDPPVLIMDEPAAGLDPRARIELRELLFALARRNKAILISSHILTELSEICHGVIIIEQGRILETGTVSDVIARGAPKRTIVIKALERMDDLERALLESPSVDEVRPSATELQVDFSGSEQDCAALLQSLVQKGFRIIEFKQQKAGLEEVFMRITKGKVQ